MQSCLGLYIEKNLIKYAKVSKEKNEIKIDNFGVKFYDNINKAIKQIVEETFSYKTPISVNLSGETYNYFQMFSLLTKKDLQKAIDMEFETYCSEKGYNKNLFEAKYAAVQEIDNKEKIKIIHISDGKIELNKINQTFEGRKLSSIFPISMTIPNLIKAKPKENYLIINLEDITTVTTIYDQKIYNVEKLDEGSQEILDKISFKENSVAKAYDICKNTTIYTSEITDFGSNIGSNLEDIMPTLYTIVGKIQKIINENLQKIDKIYLTGTGALINNIDLYFQEYLGDIRCEILRPYFVQNVNNNVNIKDYIEVNSAISLAMQGVGEGITGINFKKQSLLDKFPETGSKKSKKDSKNNVDLSSLTEALSRGELALIRTAVAILIFIIIYGAFSTLLVKQINDKENENEKTKTLIRKEISKIEEDTATLNKKASEYSTLTTQLKTASEKVSDINKSKNLIPNLLNRIMFVIPENVQLTSVQNDSGTHIIINAQAATYEHLGYFIAKIKTDSILTQVTSTSGIKQDGVVKITIEGELP